jgi:hypothetical protein
MNVALDCSNRHTQRLGRIVDRISFDKAEQQHIALRRLQVANRRERLLYFVLLRRLTKGRGPRVTNLCCCFQCLMSLIGLPLSSHSNVPGHPKHKRGQFVFFALHRRQRSNKLCKRLGCLLLREMIVAMIAQKEPKQWPLKLLDQSFIRDRLTVFQLTQVGLIAFHIARRRHSHQCDFQAEY